MTYRVTFQHVRDYATVLVLVVAPDMTAAIDAAWSRLELISLHRNEWVHMEIIEAETP